MKSSSHEARAVRPALKAWNLAGGGMIDRREIKFEEAIEQHLTRRWFRH